jgi:hypothetical protein
LEQIKKFRRMPSKPTPAPAATPQPDPDYDPEAIFRFDGPIPSSSPTPFTP